MNKICQLTLPGGLEIEMLLKNGRLGYTFVHEGQNYGTAVKLTSKKVEDIAAACLMLYTNAQETYNELIKNK